MAGLVPAIHVLSISAEKTWMPGTRPGMTPNQRICCASMATTDFTRTEIEAGRRLFAGEWHFVAAAGTPASLPPMRGVEIAFAGRSNVGKSSLINALTGRKNLARISRTPGRTQELVFFTGGDTLNVVDMPGYGYAAAAKSKIAAWPALSDAFLRGRS